MGLFGGRKKPVYVTLGGRRVELSDLQALAQDDERAEPPPAAPPPQAPVAVADVEPPRPEVAPVAGEQDPPASDHPTAPIPMPELPPEPPEPAAPAATAAEEAAATAAEPAVQPIVPAPDTDGGRRRPKVLALGIGVLAIALSAATTFYVFTNSL